MSEFKRGITKENFIKELNSNLYFQKIIADKDLFIAIRNNYLNVYYYGQSIYKIEFVKNKLRWTTHKKYLDSHSLESGYKSTENPLLEDLETIKQRAKVYGGKEKEQVKEQILSNNSLCVLDVEVTFSRETNFGRRSIDYLAVESNNGKINYVFYEAKHFENSEIRARKTPKVFEQMEKYEQALSDPNHKKEILNSYKTVYENVLDLNLSNKQKLTQLIGKNIEHIDIDSEPRLIIFEVSSEEKDNIHIQKLTNQFGEKRLILKKK